MEPLKYIGTSILGPRAISPASVTAKESRVQQTHAKNEKIGAESYFELSNNVKFVISEDKRTGEIVVELIDRKTGEVIRQIPSEEVLIIAEWINKWYGPIFDARV